MKKILSLILSVLACSASLLADTTTLPTNSLSTLSQRPKIRLSIEADKSELNQYALNIDELQTNISKKLGEANILIESTPQSPMLVLRIKAVEAGNDLAAFVQLAFFEEATLSRNNNLFSAITWSEASLVTVSKKEFSSEATKTIDAMISSFIIEYNKAFAK